MVKPLIKTASLINPQGQRIIMAVKVYSTTHCPFCVMAKDFLKQHKVDFEDINLESNSDAARRMIEKSGQTGVPVLDINGTIVVGFDRDKIKRALKLK
jgi:glutaredoxin-like YruB-family protein